MKTKIIIQLIISMTALSACSATYESKHACEKELFKDRGAVTGILAGGSFGNGTGSIATSISGGVAGSYIGEKLYKPSDSEDKRKYTRSRFTGFFTGCQPSVE